MEEEKKNQGNGPDNNNPDVKVTSKNIYIAIAAAVLIIAGLGISFVLGVFNSLTDVAEETELDETVEETELDETTEGVEETENGTVIATVNGKEVTRGEFNEALDREIAQYEMHGIDMESEEMQGMEDEIKEQVFENYFVVPILLEQKAEQANIEISDEEISNRYSEYETQFGGEEALEAQMEQLGMTRDDLEEEIVRELSLQKYLDQYLENYLEENPDEVIDEEEIKPDEEEVKEFYNQLVDSYAELEAMLEEEDSEMPREQIEMQQSQIEEQFRDILEAEDFEEARPILEEEMREDQVAQERQEKEQRIFTELIEKLREESEIEFLEDL